MTSMNIGTKIFGVTWPTINSKHPSDVNIKQEATKPLIKADRAGDGFAFLARKNMTPIPVNSAAARRQTTPTDIVSSRPQSASKRLSANINVSAKVILLPALLQFLKMLTSLDPLIEWRVSCSRRRASVHGRRP